MWHQPTKCTLKLLTGWINDNSKVNDKILAFSKVHCEFNHSSLLYSINVFGEINEAFCVWILHSLLLNCSQLNNYLRLYRIVIVIMDTLVKLITSSDPKIERNNGEWILVWCCKKRLYVSVIQIHLNCTFLQLWVFDGYFVLLFHLWKMHINSVVSKRLYHLCAHLHF